jgi:quinohemoprotein ethanol dehydrogenase
MDLRKTAVGVTAMIGLILTMSVVLGQQQRRVDDAALKAAGKTGEDWLTYGLSQGETRFSPLNQINTWSFDTGMGGGGQEATSLEWNDTIYGITNWSIVFAVDARSGKEKWRWDPEVNQTAVRPRICCGVNVGISSEGSGTE